MDETLAEADISIVEATAARRLEYLGRFAPPVAARFGAWRQGRLLVMFDGSALPARCIKCGGEGGWGHVAVLRLVWLPAYMRWLAGFVFIALGFARRTRMEVVLCAACHRRRQARYRRAGVLLVVGLALLGILLWRPTWVGVEAAGAALVGAGYYFRRARPVTVRWMGLGLVHVSGAAPGFLAALPIGGPPGVGVTVEDLADRLTHVRDGRRRRRRRCRRRRRDRETAADAVAVELCVASHLPANTGDAGEPLGSL